MAKGSTDLNRLCTAIQASRQVLERYRTNRTMAVRQYVGARWSEEASREKVPFNLLSLYVQIVSRNLIAKNPRVMLSTFDVPSKPAVSAAQDWLNKHLPQIGFATTIKRVVIDALFSVGVAKVALASPLESAMSAWQLQAGMPGVWPIDLDDFFFDVHARDFSEVSFIGHRFRCPLEIVRDSPRFNKTRKDLTPSTDHKFNEQGDERINVLMRGFRGNDEEIEDMVDLVEVYIPRHKCVYTLPEDALSGVTAPGHGGEPQALLEQDWIGSDKGPYAILGLQTVPGNCMPKGPIQDVIELHLSLNKMLRKLIRQAERQKDNTFVQRGGEADAKRIETGDDGEIIPVDNPKDIMHVSMGGPNSLTFQFFLQLKDIASWLAGNLDIMGGLSPQSKTATQDAMLNQNSTRGIVDMQENVETFASDVLERMFWFAWNHPDLVMESRYDQPGVEGVGINRYVGPWNHPGAAIMPGSNGQPQMVRVHPRSGQMPDVKVDPYSMLYSTPQQRANDLNQILMQVYIPLQQAAAQQGIAFDFSAYLEIMARLKDMPDLSRIITYQEPQIQDSPPQQPPQMAPQETTHIRENMPGRTRQGNDMNMLNALAGVDGGGANNGQLNGQAM